MCLLLSEIALHYGALAWTRARCDFFSLIDSRFGGLISYLAPLDILPASETRDSLKNLEVLGSTSPLKLNPSRYLESEMVLSPSV